MRTYSAIKMIVNGNATAHLDIWHEHNTFHVFEDGSNVFEGGWSATKEFTDSWIQKYEPLADTFRKAGMQVDFEGRF